MRQVRRLAAFLPLLLLLTLSTPQTPPVAAATSFTITTAVTSGQGSIDTVDPVNPIPLGATKHYRIRPARGWMINDVLVDGRSIGPSMYASFPFVQANHSVSVSFVPFDQVQATNVATPVDKDVRILFIGDIGGARIHLERLIENDPLREFNVTIGYTDPIDYTGLLGAYYRDRGVSDVLPKISEGWDYIVAGELLEQQSQRPELFLEGVRLLYNRGWFFGKQARLILPVSWNSEDATSGMDQAIANTYRVAAGFRVPVVPCGLAWRKLVVEEGLQAGPSTESYNYGNYACASMLFAQIFGRDPAYIGLIYGFVGGAPSPAEQAIAKKIQRVAWSTWQQEKARTHYTGAYDGNATPFKTNGGHGYHFGTSTRSLSVDKLQDQIGQFDPEFGGVSFETSEGFGEVGAAGSAAQANLAGNRYDYMWRQDKEGDSVALQYLNTYVRQQFGQNPYYIWFTRYADIPADGNALDIGRNAWRESSNAFLDNQDTANNPGRKSRAPMSHVGWGRIWEERSDIEMMEPDLLHATGPVMSMFAAQAYALISGRDASRYGSWGYEGSLAEQARYAERVGFTTIMQAGTLDINEPYESSPYDVPIFNQNSVFYTAPATLYAQDDVYVVPAGGTPSISLPAPGVLANDTSAAGKPITAVLKSEPTADSFSLSPNGSFTYVPPPLSDSNIPYLQSFTYAASDGTGESNVARVTLIVLKAALTATAQPNAPTNINHSSSDGGSIAVQIPTGALDKTTLLIFNPVSNGSASDLIKRRFTLTGYRNYAEITGLTFQQPITITITYTDADVAGLNEDELKVYFRNPPLGAWSESGVTVTQRDPANNRITVQVSHLTQFGIGSLTHTYLPLTAR